MSVSPTDLAWLAGIVDGEGTVGISRTNNKNIPHPNLRPHFQISNTDMRILNRCNQIIYEVVGKLHSLVVTNKGMERERTGYRIAVHTQWELMILLPMLLPYLVAKKERAELILEFCKRRNHRMAKRWHEFKDQDEEVYAHCRELNRRGNGTVVPLVARSG